MQNNTDVINKAKKRLKKYRMCAVIGLVIGVICYAFIGYLGSLFLDTYPIPYLLRAVLYILSLVVFAGLSGKIGFILRQKVINSVINEELDPYTYLAILELENLNYPSAVRQLVGEYYCGNYQNVVSICKAKLSDPKWAKRYKYLYLHSLADVYFDIGDDENLRKVCEQIEAELLKESPKKQEKYRKRFIRMRFYVSYLNRDVDACFKIMESSPAEKMRIYECVVTFRKARLALIQGNQEEANGYYEKLAKEAPNLNYGKLAAAKLASQKNEEPDGRCEVFEISDVPAQSVLFSSKKYKWSTALLVCMTCISFIVSMYYNYSYWSNNQQMRAIEELIEQECGEVEVHDVFYLMNGEEEVDFLFICSNDTKLFMGHIYRNIYQPGEYYCNVLNQFDLSDFFEQKLDCVSCDFYTVLYRYKVRSYFYADKEKIPDGCEIVSKFKVNRKEMYFVVEEIK